MQLTSNQGDVFDVSGKETYAPGKGYHGSSKFSDIASGLTLIMPTQFLPAKSRTKLWACRRSNLRIAYQTSQRYLIRRNRPCTTGILSSASGTILWGDYNRKVPPICSSYCSELLGQLSDNVITQSTANLPRHINISCGRPLTVQETFDAWCNT
jgi:hypothetical protein